MCFSDTSLKRGETCNEWSWALKKSLLLASDCSNFYPAQYSWQWRLADRKWSVLCYRCRKPQNIRKSLLSCPWLPVNSALFPTSCHLHSVSKVLVFQPVEPALLIKLQSVVNISNIRWVEIKGEVLLLLSITDVKKYSEKSSDGLALSLFGMGYTWSAEHTQLVQLQLPRTYLNRGFTVCQTSMSSNRAKVQLPLCKWTTLPEIALMYYHCLLYPCSFSFGHAMVCSCSFQEGYEPWYGPGFWTR